MQKDTIVYFGIIQYEYNNAMCQHSKGIRKLIGEVGFRAITIGVSPNVSYGSFRKINDDTYVIGTPKKFIDRVKECILSKGIVDVLLEIGLDRIKTFIMADFRYIPMKTIGKYCEKHDIYYAVDIMDRFVAEESISSKLKKIDCNLRMRYLYPKISRRIYICHSYNELIGEGEHTAVIPGVTWTRYLAKQKDCDNCLIFLAFLGYPGLKCEKEKIDWVIKAIYEENLSNRFKVYLAGFDKGEFIKNNPDIERYITDNIILLGRVNHNHCINLLKESDFSLVIRPDTTLSKYGFSTKIGEAFSCGIPVLATDTSDNSLYIQNGRNGYVCGCTYEEVSSMLIAISKLKSSDIYKMKKNTYEDNPLYYKDYINQFKKVVISE